MKAICTFLVAAILTLWLADCTTANKTAASPGAETSADAFAAERAKTLQTLRASLTGKEQQPATAVFQNIKKLNNVNADRLLSIMDIWGKVLGVGCDHCHVPNEWASEVKPEKETTRQMFDLTNRINADLRQLDLDGISCFTCHRGQKRPARRPI